MENKYYDGTKLLSLKDANGNQPEIYICTSNRTAGKTTYWNRYFVNRFIKNGEKFMLLFRETNELDGDLSDKFFKDIQGLFFQDYIMTHRRNKEGYCTLFLNDICCGYATSLKNVGKIKNNSHLFSDVARIMFDEFMPEDNRYLKDEVNKLKSIHTSIARGQGEQVRYVPVFLIGNPVTIINPYYTEMGISNRLRYNTKFLRGDGWVLEQGYNESASKAQEESAFNRAFGANDSYIQYMQQGAYLNDSQTFINKMKGESYYVATIKYEGSYYAIRNYQEEGIIYCDDNADLSYPLKISLTTDDHDINYVMLKSHDTFVQNMRWYFDHGCFRFKNLRCKDMVFRMLAYK